MSQITENLQYLGDGPQGSKLTGARSPGLPWILLTVTIEFSCDSLKSMQGPQRCTGFYIQHLEGAFECTRLSYQSMGKIIISSNVQIHNVIKVTHGTKCYPWTSKSAKLDRQQFTYKLLNATWNIPPKVLSTVSRLAGSQFRSCKMTLICYKYFVMFWMKWIMVLMDTYI